MTPPPLGLDVRAALRGPCGIARYQVELARALLAADPEQRLLLYAATRAGAAATAVLPADLRDNPRVRLFAPRLPGKFVNLVARVPGLGAESFTGRLALFHHTDLVYLRGFRCPQVVTVHDLAFEFSAEFHAAGFHGPVRTRMRAALAAARGILVPSAATRSELVGRWQVDGERIAVVPLGADHVLHTAPAGRRDPRRAPDRPYFLAVGTLEPRKNFLRLLRAWRRARAAGLAVDLVHVGARGWLTEEFDREVARVDDGGAFVALGARSDGELRAWIEGAQALCYPSLYEGFGLPVVEAFVLGAPVLTSARSATEEMAGDAALTVDPLDEAALAAALLRLGREPALRAELSRRGRARGAEFTWARTAAATLAAYRRFGALPAVPRLR